MVGGSRGECGWYLVIQMSSANQGLLDYPPAIGRYASLCALHARIKYDWAHLSTGTSTWAFYPNMVLDGHNVLALTLTGVDVPTCLDACRAQPTCASVDYKEDNLKCFMNDVKGMLIIIKMLLYVSLHHQIWPSLSYQLWRFSCIYAQIIPHRTLIRKTETAQQKCCMPTLF